MAFIVPDRKFVCFDFNQIFQCYINNKIKPKQTDYPSSNRLKAFVIITSLKASHKPQCFERKNAYIILSSNSIKPHDNNLTSWLNIVFLHSNSFRREWWKVLCVWRNLHAIIKNIKLLRNCWSFLHIEIAWELNSIWGSGICSPVCLIMEFGFLKVFWLNNDFRKERSLLKTRKSF